MCRPVDYLIAGTTLFRGRDMPNGVREQRCSLTPVRDSISVQQVGNLLQQGFELVFLLRGQVVQAFG